MIERVKDVLVFLLYINFLNYVNCLTKFYLKNMFKNAGHEYENAILAHKNEQVLSSRYQPSVNKQHPVSTLGSPCLR